MVDVNDHWLECILKSSPLLLIGTTCEPIQTQAATSQVDGELEANLTQSVGLQSVSIG